MNNWCVNSGRKLDKHNKDTNYLRTVPGLHQCLNAGKLYSCNNLKHRNAYGNFIISLRLLYMKLNGMSKCTSMPAVEKQFAFGKNMLFSCYPYHTRSAMTTCVDGNSYLHPYCRYEIHGLFIAALWNKKVIKTARISMFMFIQFPEMCAQWCIITILLWYTAVIKFSHDNGNMSGYHWRHYFLFK